jgi:LysM repeat protein
MRNSTHKLTLILVVLAFIVSACDLNAPAPTPTVEGIDPINPVGQPPTTTATLTPTASLTPTVAQILIETPLPTWTPPQASNTPAPTETPGPYRHTVAVGETLGIIASKYGYDDPAIFREILRLNPVIPNENFLPVGQEILIPRQTLTPTPPGFDMTATALATRGIEIPRAIPTNAVIDCHIVQEGETITSLSLEYNTT